ncbi:MAG: DUF402 domain-containing protein [Armatimonadota bacterium]|nr:DUF402 domain-containing protein [Armatimonadota bacterium]MDR7563621.1 DUF402 domain-containing protein [Armatimonadota bacterium]MDR7567337.1 DUF402 domain-containing protein [Armatimonadota bacterium]MDR7602094.1 DUF402 domain-containing protein [Armatimonadota bacterium]
MGSGIGVRVRGLYTTALTSLLLESGFRIADPSPTIRQRFRLPEDPALPEVRIRDQADRQGILIAGSAEAVEAVVRALRRHLPLAVVRMRSRNGRWICTMDFPAPVKTFLDRVRARHAPTLPGHHRLRICDDGRLREAEVGGGNANRAQALEHALIWDRMVPGSPYRIHHRKPGARTLLLRGTVEHVGARSVVVRRTFRPGGRYDSLGFEKRAGDWGLVELEQGAWWTRRRYFRESGEEIGEIYNVNTPVEIYPEFAAYVDLEVDVVRFPDGRVEIVDTEELEARVRQGVLPRALAHLALHQAQDIALRLAGDGGVVY